MPAGEEQSQPAGQPRAGHGKLDHLKEAVDKLEQRVSKLEDAQRASSQAAEKDIAALKAIVWAAVATNVGVYVGPAYVATAAFSMAISDCSKK